MLIRLLFQENTCVGYLAYAKKTYPYATIDNIKMREISDTDLEVLAGRNWREEYSKLILVDDEVIFDVEQSTEKIILELENQILLLEDEKMGGIL